MFLVHDTCIIYKNLPFDQFSKIAEKKHNAFNVTLINSYSSVFFFQNMQLVNQAYLIIHYTL